MTPKQTLDSLAVVGVVLLLVCGTVRAATSRFQEQAKALLEQAASERKRLGLTDRKMLFAKYPTPELTLSRLHRVVPGGTAEVVAMGRFPPGTTFLFENDDVEVMKQAQSASEYRASIKVAQSVSGPSVAYLHAFAPVSGGHTRDLAVYIGGKYEWDFTAENGWRIKLKLVNEGFRDGAKEPPQSLYRAEFYRGTDARPFQVFDSGLSVKESLWQDRYSAAFGRALGEDSGPSAELQKLQSDMENFSKLSPKEQERLFARIQQIQELAMKAQQEQIKTLETQKKTVEFGCRQIHFRRMPGEVQGYLACDDEKGRGYNVNLKGTMRFLGP